MTQPGRVLPTLVRTGQHLPYFNQLPAISTPTFQWCKHAKKIFTPPLTNSRQNPRKGTPKFIAFPTPLVLYKWPWNLSTRVKYPTLGLSCSYFVVLASLVALASFLRALISALVSIMASSLASILPWRLLICWSNVLGAAL